MQSASIEANRRKCPPSSRRSPSWQRYAFLGFCKSLFSKIVTNWSRAQRFEFLLSGSILRCRCRCLQHAMRAAGVAQIQKFQPGAIRRMRNAFLATGYSISWPLVHPSWLLYSIHSNSTALTIAIHFRMSIIHDNIVEISVAGGSEHHHPINVPGLVS